MAIDAGESLPDARGTVDGGGVARRRARGVHDFAGFGAELPVPVTEKFTLYSLPTRAADSRHFTLDTSTEPPTLWISYTAAAKIARVQFRTNTAH